MTKIMTAINNPKINDELKNEKDVEILCKDIPYKEGILEILEILEKENRVDYIILDSDLPGEINIENLINNILEKNEKIKLIILIKIKNKSIKNIYENNDNENIIKIYYQNKIDINFLKNYKNNFQNENNKKIILKNIFNIYKKNNIQNKKSKIITFLGERNVGKSVLLIEFSYYLQNKNFNILIIEQNDENSNINKYLGIRNFSKKNEKLYKNKKLKNKYKKLNKKYKKIFLNKNILKNMIIKVNKKIDLIFYNKLINFNFIKNIEKEYDYILIEIYSKKNKYKNKKIINNSNKNLLLIRPNLIGIENAKKIIEKNELINMNIIINNYNKYSIDENIIKTIFNKNKIIAKIKYNEKYEKLINQNFIIKNLIYERKDIK